MPSTVSLKANDSVLFIQKPMLLLLQLGNVQKVVFGRFPMCFAKVEFDSVLARKGPIAEFALVGGP